jgi:hypothetical protein
VLKDYRGMPINIFLNVMRIIPTAGEEFSAVLNANPDVEF